VHLNDWTHLFHHAKAIRVIPLQFACAHEGEYGHDVVQYTFGYQPGQLACHEQRSLTRSRIAGGTNDFDDDLDADVSALNFSGVGSFLEDGEGRAEYLLLEIIDTIFQRLLLGEQSAKDRKERREKSGAAREGLPVSRF
jgi:hypothetical protein